jgi:chromosome segregation ATPase
MATTPYRKLQEENISIKNRVKELEDISKAHQKQNGDLHLKIADLETVVNLLKDRLETTEEPLRQLCHIIKVSNYFENIRATQMKQARDIVDINYVP